MATHYCILNAESTTKTYYKLSAEVVGESDGRKFWWPGAWHGHGFPTKKEAIDAHNQHRIGVQGRKDLKETGRFRFVKTVITRTVEEPIDMGAVVGIQG
jgi:hypothetical protein